LQSFRFEKFTHDSGLEQRVVQKSQRVTLVLCSKVSAAAFNCWCGDGEMRRWGGGDRWGDEEVGRWGRVGRSGGSKISRALTTSATPCPQPAASGAWASRDFKTAQALPESTAQSTGAGQRCLAGCCPGAGFRSPISAATEKEELLLLASIRGPARAALLRR